MAYKVLTDPGTNKATGILYIDRVTREPKEVRARAVVLCAQALESTRILLNSANRQNPNGLGELERRARALPDGPPRVRRRGRGDARACPAAPSVNGPNRPNGIYVIRFRNTTTSRAAEGLHPRLRLPGRGRERVRTSGRRASARPTRRRCATAGAEYISLGGFGETLARAENRVEIDPTGVVDAFGIPVLKVHMAFGENEKAMMKDMAASAAEMLEAAGATSIRPNLDLDTVPGWGIHEVGTARMGSDPKTSVLNAFCQSHDVPNLYVMDGSCFVSIACQNPTLTIMALAVRSTDALLERMRTGEV